MVKCIISLITIGILCKGVIIFRNLLLEREESKKKRRQRMELKLKYIREEIEKWKLRNDMSVN